MSFEALPDAPDESDFIPLYEHEQRTPASFHDGKPVLHLVATVTVKFSPFDWHMDTPLIYLTQATEIPDNDPDADPLQRPPPQQDGLAHTPGVKVWVTSTALLFWTPDQVGVSIPYPTIAMNASHGNDVILELNLSDSDTADEDIESLQIRLDTTDGTLEHYNQDPHSERSQARATHAAGMNGTAPHNANALALFKAISKCQELNPDPPGSDDEEGGPESDPTAPGATGWITSDNMEQFMDESGNFRVPEGMSFFGENGQGADEVEQEPLGPGAGTTRTADEAVRSGALSPEEERRGRRLEE